MNARSLFPIGKRYRLLRRPSDEIRPSSPRPARRDCHGRLLAALLERAGPGSEIAWDSLTAWASATFIGARHGLVLILRSEDSSLRADALAAMLPEADFAIPGHLVADLAVERQPDGEAGEARLLLSVLTIEAW